MTMTRLRGEDGLTDDDELRQSLEERLGLKTLDMYGLSEAMGPGVSVECLRQSPKVLPVV